jgi:hypothetical protein
MLGKQQSSEQFQNHRAPTPAAAAAQTSSMKPYNCMQQPAVVLS